MEIDLTTPALLFSAISLIMLAYTNRFLSYAQLVRTLKDQYRENHSAVIPIAPYFLQAMSPASP